jgi:glycerate kinase
MGAMSALGVRFLDERSAEVFNARNGAGGFGAGEDLIKVHGIDLSGLHPAVKETVFTVMCDIGNPFTGPEGATYVYGPQKGGTPERLTELEAGMTRYASAVQKISGVDLNKVSGSGAAGGLAGALHVFLNARLDSGIRTVLDLYRFDDALKNADLVVTGEGRVDGQSAYGKVLYGVGMACRERGVPAIAITGGMGDGAEAVYGCGIWSVMPIVPAAMALGDVKKNTRPLFADAARRMFLMVKAGQVEAGNK